MTYDFFAPSTRDDPYTLFNRLRTNDPVFETDFGYWYVTRYDDVAKLLRDPRLIAGQGVPDSLGVHEGTLRSVMDAWLMATDGAAHARTRRLISRAFTPRAVEALRVPVHAPGGSARLRSGCSRRRRHHRRARVSTSHGGRSLALRRRRKSMAR